LCLLGLDLGSGDMCLKGYEGSGKVGQSGCGSKVAKGATAMIACCCDTASTVAARSGEAAAAA
jgi:hypothetical protein